MSIIEPAEWYAQQDLNRHYMRRTNRPFEEGVSRGQLRCITEAKRAGLHFGIADVYSTYAIIADNRMSKGRSYGMRLMDCIELRRSGKAICFDVYSPMAHVAAAFCVFVKPDVCYISGWSHIDGILPFSPIPFLCAKIFEWCKNSSIDTLDIGIADEPSLVEFKRRLAFRCIEND